MTMFRMKSEKHQLKNFQFTSPKGRKEWAWFLSIFSFRVKWTEVCVCVGVDG